MKIRFIDRLLIALTGLLVLLLGLGVLVFGLGIFPFKVDTSFLTASYALWQRAVIVVVALVLCALGLHSVTALFHKRQEKGVFVQRTEYGDLSISMSAMENMVKRCIDTHEDLRVTSTRIHHTRDGVVVDMRISLSGGVNIPITVNALQKQIKHYITSCSGVDVREVRVMVETEGGGSVCPDAHDLLTADALAAEQAGSVLEAASEATQAIATETSEKERTHQRIFKHGDEPQIEPEPPAEATSDEPLAEAEQQTQELPPEPADDAEDETPREAEYVVEADGEPGDEQKEDA